MCEMMLPFQNDQNRVLGRRERKLAGISAGIYSTLPNLRKSRTVSVPYFPTYHHPPSLSSASSGSLEEYSTSDSSEFCEFVNSERSSLSSGSPYNERTACLVKGPNGFGFVLRGAKGLQGLHRINRSLSLQYLDEIDEGGVADIAGLRKGDFLLKVNGQDVRLTPHEEVVSLIRKSGDRVTMTVANGFNCESIEDEEESPWTETWNQNMKSSQMPMEKVEEGGNKLNKIYESKTEIITTKEYRKTQVQNRKFSTLPRNSIRNTSKLTFDTFKNRKNPPPEPPPRNPSTTLSRVSRLNMVSRDLRRNSLSNISEEKLQPYSAPNSASNNSMVTILKINTNTNASMNENEEKKKDSYSTFSKGTASVLSKNAMKEDVNTNVNSNSKSILTGDKKKNKEKVERIRIRSSEAILLPPPPEFA